MGVGGQHHAPAALPPRKTRYPLYSRLVPESYWLQLHDAWPQKKMSKSLITYSNSIKRLKISCHFQQTSEKLLNEYQMAITQSLILLKGMRYCHFQDISFLTLEAQTGIQRRTDRPDRQSFPFKTRRKIWGCYRGQSNRVERLLPQ